MKARTTGKGIHTCYRLGRRDFYTVLWSGRTNRSREESSNKYRDPDHLDRDAAGSEGPGAQPHPAQPLGRGGLKLPGAAGTTGQVTRNHSRAVRVDSQRASARRCTGNTSTRRRPLSDDFLPARPWGDPTRRLGAGPPHCHPYPVCSPKSPKILRSSVSSATPTQDFKLHAVNP